ALGPGPDDRPVDVGRVLAELGGEGALARPAVREVPGDAHQEIDDVTPGILADVPGAPLSTDLSTCFPDQRRTCKFFVHVGPFAARVLAKAGLSGPAFAMCGGRYQTHCGVLDSGPLPGA